MAEQPKRPERNGRHCRHYSYQGGIMDGRPVCDRGIDLQPKGLRTLALSLPCMPDPVDSCRLREEFTSEEVEEERRRVIAAMSRYAEILQTIPRGEPGTNGEMDCPTCGGKIGYAFSDFNGHLSAVCSTPKCFAVME